MARNCFIASGPRQSPAGKRSCCSIAATNTRRAVSGLFELFPANEPVLNSLRGLADAMDPEGYLIYTNQPWHPQVEFIARVLRNREGKPWIMRRRTQAEMDQLVAATGFCKVRQEIDECGIFSVSLAKKTTRRDQAVQISQSVCEQALT